MATEFKLPDLGEGVKKADVVKVLVKAGDTIALEQPVVEVETDKAGLDVPSTLAGTVEEVRVKEGDSVAVGATILVVAEAASEPAAAEPSAEPADSPATEASDESAAAPEAEARPSETVAGEGQERPERAMAAATETQGDPVFASPSVRTFARRIGVDIRQVAGSGPGGRISEDDIMQFSRRGRPGAPPATLLPTAEMPDFARYGQVSREKLNNVRKATAQHMALCWATIPHVTIFDQADITELEALRQRYKKQAEAAGGKLTITAIMLRLAASALRAFPKFNASLDVRANEIVHKHFINIGVAADTERGLVVPVIREADRKNMIQLSAELVAFGQKARDGKLSPDEMQGGTFTLTNLGGIGIGHFTPIINYPEVAILGLGRAVETPVWRDGDWVSRLMLPLSLSIDHRLVDGADGARFLRWIIRAIEEPLLLALEG